MTGLAVAAVVTGLAVGVLLVVLAMVVVDGWTGGADRGLRTGRTFRTKRHVIWCERRAWIWMPRAKRDIRGVVVIGWGPGVVSIRHRKVQGGRA